MTLPSTDAVLREGMKGEAVRNLQADLVTIGFDPGPVDGRFGAKTAAAVRRFQERRALLVDGKAGAITLQAIDDALAAKADREPAPAPETWPQQEQGAAPPPADWDNTLSGPPSRATGPLVAVLAVAAAAGAAIAWLWDRPLLLVGTAVLCAAVAAFLLLKRKD